MVVLQRKGRQQRGKEQNRQPEASLPRKHQKADTQEVVLQRFDGCDPLGVLGQLFADNVDHVVVRDDSQQLSTGVDDRNRQQIEFLDLFRDRLLVFA